MHHRLHHLCVPLVAICMFIITQPAAAYAQPAQARVTSTPQAGQIAFPIAEPFAPYQIPPQVPKATAAVRALLRGSSVSAQNGWIVARLQGDPYQIGFQNGYLTAQSADYWIQVDLGAPGDASRSTGDAIAQTIVWPLVPREYQQEMRGIADGMKAAGYPQDTLWDVVAANDWADQGVYAHALPVMAVKATTATEAALTNPSKGGCSAFMATGHDWTTDGRPVMGHDTWSAYDQNFMYNIMFYVHPSHGYDFAYQSAGGQIWSGQDWYENSSGLMLLETTVSDRAYNTSGLPIFVRAREVAQYDATVAQAVKTFTTNSNGAYCSEWLIGDRSGEIASLQVGTLAYDLSTTRNGMFGSCNYTWGPNVIYESSQAKAGIAPHGTPNGSGIGIPAAPTPRWIRWKQIEAQYKGLGEISAQVAMTFQADTYDTKYGLANHGDANTLCGEPDIAYPSLTAMPGFPAYPGTVNSKGVPTTSDGGAYDGKVTTETMVLHGLQMYARWGHPNGDAFANLPFPENVTSFLALNSAWAANNGELAVFGLETFASQTPNAWTLLRQQPTRGTSIHALQHK